MEESVARRVDSMINERTVGDQLGMKIYLNVEDFKKFMDEVRPDYEKKWGPGWPTNMSLGEHNIIYRGNFICVKFDEDQELVK